jgi:UDPglucose 6-dehydrogenase
VHFIEKIKRHFHGDLQGKTIAVLGLSFKPDTDDMRFAPSITIIEALIKSGARVVAYDPVAIANAKKVLPKDTLFAASPYEAVKDADAVAVVTEWNEFRQLDMVKLAKGLKDRVLFDGRNIYDPQALKDLGYTYYGVGRM